MLIAYFNLKIIERLERSLILRCRHTWKDIIKTDLKTTGCDGVDGLHLFN